jgi:quercetin dioxygenase-like cupin family protein
VTFKARGPETGGALTALESVIAPGDGPPLHVHTGEDEVIYVLDGELRIRLGDVVHASPAGSFTFIPRGLEHCFHNAAGAPSRILVLFTPSGMEAFFERFVAVQDFAEAAAPAGMTVVGPPLR